VIQRLLGAGLRDLLDHFGRLLWLIDAGGNVCLGNDPHELVLTVHNRDAP